MESSPRFVPAGLLILMPFAFFFVVAHTRRLIIDLVNKCSSPESQISHYYPGRTSRWWNAYARLYEDGKLLIWFRVWQIAGICLMFLAAFFLIKR
jgi:hypothetical protein